MILLIDNYDSFVYNLARYTGKLGRQRRVVRNDAITLDEIAAMAPEAIILSPGPCTPQQAGICNSLIENLSSRFPILGICLGLQTLFEASEECPNVPVCPNFHVGMYTLRGINTNTWF